MLQIVLKSGSDREKAFPVGDGRTSIGRHPENKILIEDREASDLHAEIRSDGSGRFVLRDLGSKYGTLLNGVSIVEQFLSVGDEIRIGTTVLLVSDEKSPTPRPEGTTPHAGDDSPPGKRYELSTAAGNVDFLRTEERDPRRIRAAHRKLTTLYQISQAINSIRTLPGLLQKTLDLIIEAVKADCGCILVEDDQGELVPKAVRVPFDIPGEELAVSGTMAREALTKGKAILTSDAAEDPRYEDADSTVLQKIRSAMCVPLSVSANNLAVVSVHRTRPLYPFVEEDLEFMVVICNQAAICVENARLFEDLQRTNRLLMGAKDEIVRWTRELEVKVEKRTTELRTKSEQLKVLSITDGMTGLHNHQHFQNELAKEVNRMLRYRGDAEKATFALVMADLDNLKFVNDTCGHLAGDSVLKQVAQAIRQHLRTVDFVARYGGDEFAILLPETNLAGARVVAEKLVQEVRSIEVTYRDLLGDISAVQRAEIEERLGQSLDRSDRIPTTLSVGVAVYTHPQTPAEIIKEADEALYRAKKAGKDRVMAGASPSRDQEQEGRG